MSNTRHLSRTGRADPPRQKNAKAGVRRRRITLRSLMSDPYPVKPARVTPSIGVREGHGAKIGLQVDPGGEIGRGLEYEVVTGHTLAAHGKAAGRVFVAEHERGRAQPVESVGTGTRATLERTPGPR